MLADLMLGGLVLGAMLAGMTESGPHLPSEALSSAPSSGIVFTLDGVDQPTLQEILGDITHDALFKKPLQIQVRPPQAAAPAQLTLAFDPAQAAQREQVRAAMQRLKTILLRYGVQVDSVVIPGERA